MKFVPLSRSFHILAGTSLTKPVQYKSSGSDGYLFTGFDETPADPFTHTTPSSKHLHPGVIFEEGVSYYYDTVEKCVTTTETTLPIGVGNATGGLVVAANETYHLLDDLTNKIVDDEGNRLTYMNGD